MELKMNDYKVKCESCGKEIMRSQAQDISDGERIFMCEECYKNYTEYQKSKEN